MNGNIIGLIHLTNKVDYIFVVYLVATMYITAVICVK